ncbi:MAG TPA: hypothetical protein VNA25_01755 [Phycisphaerae bacterium]|nr:hypothetical protein [Phycisphaerae bacterium]
MYIIFSENTYDRDYEVRPVLAREEQRHLGRLLQGALQLALDHQPEGRVGNDGAIEISAKKPLFLMELER